MKKVINSILKMIFVFALSVMTTSCSLLSDISNSLIELEVSYNDLNTIEDVGKIYSYPIDEEHISSVDSGIKYMDNEILIVVDPQTDLDAVSTLAEKYSGEVVGCIEKTGDYQILLKTVHTFDDINSLVAEMAAEDIVISAYPNYVASLSNDAINYGNKWKGDLKNPDDCKGKSWGVEAINAPAAWDLLEDNSDKVNKNLRVGVIDSGFDLEHEDLGFAEKFPDYNKGSDDHGTHVAGTIAAISDNEKGICGVYPYGKGNLYAISSSGVQSYAENGHMWNSIMTQKIMCSELVLRNVKVINQSQGFNWWQFDKKKSEETGSAIINEGVKEFTTWWNDSQNEYFEVYMELSNSYADFLQRLINLGYDFVLVSAAGNDSEYASEHLESKYSSWLNLIDEKKYPHVYNRIIVVGSIGEKYGISSFSNAGDRVDVYAPGEKIFSTLPNNKYSYKKHSWDFLDGLGTWDGTSMASPHVAGVAAMVWAANSDLTGEMVKLIVCGRTTDMGTGVNIVDAEKAVSYALNKDISEWAEENKQEDPTLGSIMAYVVTADKAENRISDATVEAINVETNERTPVKTDRDGHFELILPKGKYRISVSAYGYESYTYENEIVCEPNGVNYVDWAKLVSKKKYVDYFYNKTLGDVISYYGEENCSEYTLLHGNTGVYVPFLQYVFVPENGSMGSKSKISLIVVLENGEMFSGAIIGDTAINAVSKSHRKFAPDKIEVSDVNGNYIYIDKPNENMIYYIDLNESPVSDRDSVEKHMNTMALQSGLVKFRYDVNSQITTTTVVDENWIENARTQVTRHYKDSTGLSGEFVCFPDEDVIESDVVKFVLRYSRSQEEIHEFIEAGVIPSANVYQSLIEIEIKTGKVSDESGNIWYLDFNSNVLLSFDPKNEVDLLSDFIKVAASYDNSFLDKSADDKWNIISMVAYYKEMNYVDDSTLHQWLKIAFNDETVPSLNLPYSITRKDSGYEFVFGDPQELNVDFVDIKENSDGTISIVCNVYSFFQTNTQHECEYGLLKKCEVVLAQNRDLKGTTHDYSFRIKDVKRIFSYKYAGSCGENVMYAIDENNIAFIYGTGRMDDYDFTTASGFRSNSPFSEGPMPIVNISKIVIEEGVTYIGTCAFPADCVATEIYFPQSITEIGNEVIRTVQGETNVWNAGLSISNNYTIYCYKDSYVHQYAVEHNLKYKLR